VSGATDLDEVAARLTERLGERVRLDASAARASWYRVGGPVAIWVDVASVDDLSALAAALAAARTAATCP
jgi:UDP-N-acetylenolpyruvoylglucosamine reductase